MVTNVFALDVTNFACIVVREMLVLVLHKHKVGSVRKLPAFYICACAWGREYEQWKAGGQQCPRGGHIRNTAYMYLLNGWLHNQLAYMQMGTYMQKGGHTNGDRCETRKLKTFITPHTHTLVTYGYR